MTISPDQIAQNLRKIASKIEASKNPKKNLVIQDLNEILKNISVSSRVASKRVHGPTVLTKLSMDVSVDKEFQAVMASFEQINGSDKIVKMRVAQDACKHIASLMFRLAKDDELSLWDYEEGERVKEWYDYAQKEVSDSEKLESSLNSLKRWIDKFINVIKSEKKPETQPF